MTTRVTTLLKFNLRSRYYQTHIHLGDEWITAFNTKVELNEKFVMPFRLTNVSSTFMHVMVQILQTFLVQFVIYFDDILINQHTTEVHLDLMGAL